MKPDITWKTHVRSLVRYSELGLTLDAGRSGLTEEWVDSMEGASAAAMRHVAELEAGEVVNTDENRQVGHYWLRQPSLAPTDEIREAIEGDVSRVEAFVEAVLSGEIRPAEAGKFTALLLVGIGGSALGPQLIDQALAEPGRGLPVYFLDNTDPGGIDRVLGMLGDRLAETLVLVISKSGKTPETANGMLETEAAFVAKGLAFARHAVAVTGTGSHLDQKAGREDWLARFPMYDWVGGRTSVMSAVGLLPAALAGIDIRALLAGAAAMDRRTRSSADPLKNAALLLALAWYRTGNGKGDRDMVILPYSDRLSLMSKYLQQLVMESLGKEVDRDGKTVNQGIVVYGNKGSTDQHAYVQQLRDGPDNYFATFIEVRRSREESVPSIAVDATGATSADYLQGFLRGTRQALAEKGHPSLTISLPEVSATTVGALIALYERAVTLYASFVNINAYHQPGVEAGKAAAGTFLTLLAKVRDYLAAHAGVEFMADSIAKTLGEDDVEAVYHAATHLASTREGYVVHWGPSADEDTFSCV